MAPAAPDPCARLLKDLADPRQVGPGMPPAPTRAHDLALRRHHGPPKSPLRDCHAPHLARSRGIKPLQSLAPPLIPGPTSTATSHRWIRANTKKHGRLSLPLVHLQRIVCGQDGTTVMRLPFGILNPTNHPAGGACGSGKLRSPDGHSIPTDLPQHGAFRSIVESDGA